MEQGLLQLVQTLGPWAALVVFFVWQSSVREARWNEAFQKQDDFIRSTMLGAIKENTEAVQGVKAVLIECHGRKLA